jgi:hypothetical protein
VAVGRRAAHLVSYWIARKVNDPKYVGIIKEKINEAGLPGSAVGKLLAEEWRNRRGTTIIRFPTASLAFSGKQSLTRNKEAAFDESEMSCALC